ncbi:E3 ubiquitin-protein ligase listerin [Cladobotryum mycophilum]|uniref:E3 ubiquitin-protein ligase listerin n=1 Tax=Cladobotryum mycophilum TaxID=491253 RepID=A0ABR0SHI7_9HYPO
MKQRAQQSKAAGRPTGSNKFAGFGVPEGTGSLSYLAEPPSLSAVTDPNVVVSLKNVLKKDSTTKSKALEDLLLHAQAHPFEKDGGVEEAILDVWAQIYPRISIDNSRRVRELSHTLQFELMKSARKRMERYLPKIVGAWLAGLYDRDRSAARAANDGLASFLNTPEKVSAFWKKCQGQILDYAIDAIKETEDTLSDERSTTKEDAEAKYLRVITASLSLVLGLLQRLEEGDINRLSDRYDDYFSEETVWKSITFNESSVRKTVCHLLIVCLDRKLPYADTTQARQAILTGGLKTTQSGSALDYVRALTKLTQQNPDLWVPSPKEKKPAISRLQQFITKGSQGCAAKYWEFLDQLLSILPEDQLRDRCTASDFLSALKSGITNREEPRTNTSMAWKCYVDTAKRLVKILSDDDKLIFVKEQLFPLFDQFLFSVSDKPTAIPLGPNSITIFVEAHLAILQSTPSLVSASEEEWNRLADLLCTKISGSLPEVSREYQSSQDKISEEGRRWFALVGEIHKRLADVGEVLPDQTSSPSNRIITHCISILESRNMKPFSAARILEYALSTSQHLFVAETGQKISSFLLTAAKESMEKVVQSASSRPLLSCLRILSIIPSQEKDYEKVWGAWVEAALDFSDGPTRATALTSLVSQEKGSRFGQDNTRLQESIISQSIETVKGEANSWELLVAAVTYHALTDDSCQKLAHNLLEMLEKQTEFLETSLRALETVAKGRPRLFTQDEALHTALVAKLLGLSEITDGAVSSKALAIRTLLDGSSSSSSTLPVIGIIQSNLERAGPQSLEVSTLAMQAQQAHDTGIPLEEIFPSTNIWMQKLAPFLEQPINPSLSITNSLGGAIALSNPNTRRLDLRTIPRDRKGRSIPLRMALYAGQLFEENLDRAKLPHQFQIELLYIQCLTLQLASDQLTSRDHNGLWIALDETESISEAEGLVSCLRHNINKSSTGATWWDESVDDEASQVFRGLVNLMKEESKELTPRGVYSARALSEIVLSLTETQGLPPAFEETFLKPVLVKAAPETALLASALLSGLGETLQSSKLANNFCNRLVSDVAGASPQSDKTLMILSLLTLSARIYESGELPVAGNRIVFAVRQITSWLEDEDAQLSAPLCAEICRVLAMLLPCMGEVFGSYWEKAIEFCIERWEKAAEYPLPDALPFIHSSLKLMKALETVADPNDDLQDALRDSVSKKSKSLVELLKLPRGGTSQPLDIVDGLLRREVEKINIKHIADIADIFELVASESHDIQSAAFSLLHRAIPAEQEQRSVEILLDKTDARLPDELLSLLLDAPTLERFSDEMLAQFPSPIRSYLLSWKLVFDAYSTASYKIRNDFTENLKTDDYMSPLLNFMFDVLGHSAAQPLSLDREHITPENIKDYDIKVAESESEEKSMQWLLVHLFYLTLKYIPSLFKSWYINCKSKQTRIAAEAWTARYFSPLIISELLDEVQVWADQQEPPAEDEKELEIKVSRTSKEVTAGYEIDEAHASIVIKVPANYPIETVTVDSRNRVAVNERKWQSWIMTTQGVITFSGGGVIDGLQVFKRNIVGALKGQTECAICYSIISTDKRMPDKKCGTCKNLFHRTCLYKWFQSSNQNTCPLCRNPIDYLGADTAKRRQG